MKHNVLEGILVLSLVLLSACGPDDDGGVASLEPHSIESDAAVGEDKVPEDASAEAGGTEAPGNGENEISTDGSDNMPGNGHTGNESGISTSGEASGQERSASGTYGSIYLQMVNEEEGNAKTYSLICLDSDDIPELVVLDRGYDRFTIYTVRDRAIFCMVDSMTTVEMTYFEKSGVIAEFSRWNGGGDEGGYGQYYYQVTGDSTLTDGDLPLLSFSYNAVYDDKGIYTGTGVTDYFHLDQEIDEAAYRELLESLGIAEGEGRSCMEDSYSKEEMVELLERI